MHIALLKQLKFYFFQESTLVYRPTPTWSFLFLPFFDTRMHLYGSRKKKKESDSKKKWNNLKCFKPDTHFYLANMDSGIRIRKLKATNPCHHRVKVVN